MFFLGEFRSGCLWIDVMFSMDHTQPHWPLSAFFLTLGAMSHEGEGLKHSIESTCGIGQSDSTIVIFFIDPKVIGDTNLTIKIRIEIPLKSY